MAEPIDSNPERSPMTRRNFLIGAAAGTFTVLAVSKGPDLVQSASEFVREQYDRNRAQTLFTNGIKNDWHKLAVFPNLLQIDPTTKVSHSIYGDPGDAKWPAAQMILAVRPINVRASLLRNVADYPVGTQDRVDRALRDISPDLFSFWHPTLEQLLYLNVKDNAGLVIPLTEDGYFGAGPNSLPIDAVTVDGREARGDRLYPYRRDEPRMVFQPDDNEQQKLDRYKDDTAPYQMVLAQAQQDHLNYQAIEQHRFFGLSGVSKDASDLNGTVSRFYDGWEPLSLPKP